MSSDLLYQKIKGGYYFSKVGEFTSFALGVNMVQGLLFGVLLFSQIHSNLAYSKEDAEENVLVRHKRPSLYAFTKIFEATRALNDESESRWVSGISLFQIERSSLKAIQMTYADVHAKDKITGTEYFLVVNEVNIAKDKNAQGGDSPGAKARVELTLVHMQAPRDREDESGKKTPRASRASFYLSIDAPLVLTLQNDTVDLIKKWDEAGNYFIKENADVGFPSLKVSEVKAVAEEARIEPLVLSEPTPPLTANFALRPKLMARMTSGVNADSNNVVGVTQFDIEGTQLKALMLESVNKKGERLSPDFYLVVREQKVEFGKNSLGMSQPGAKARIVLGLVKMAMPFKKRSPSGENIERVTTVDFSTSFVTGPERSEFSLSLELVNDNVSKVEKWDDDGNYFYKGSVMGGPIPALEVKNLVPYEAPSKENISSRELRELFKAQP